MLVSDSGFVAPATASISPISRTPSLTVPVLVMSAAALTKDHDPLFAVTVTLPTDVPSAKSPVSQ